MVSDEALVERGEYTIRICFGWSKEASIIDRVIMQVLKGL